MTTNIRDPNGVRASLCAALAFHHESLDEFRQDPMSITGEFARGSILSNLKTVEGKHYETAKYYTGLLGEKADMIVDSETQAASDMAFYGSGINFVCYQGLTAHQGPSRSFDNYELNTGHLVRLLFFVFFDCFWLQGADLINFEFQQGDSETVDSSLAWSGHLAFKSSVDYHRAGNSISLMNKSS